MVSLNTFMLTGVFKNPNNFFPTIVDAVHNCATMPAQPMRPSVSCGLRIMPAQPMRPFVSCGQETMLACANAGSADAARRQCCLPLRQCRHCRCCQEAMLSSRQGRLSRCCLEAMLSSRQCRHCRCCQEAMLSATATMLTLRQCRLSRCCLEAMLSAAATMPALPMLPGGNAVIATMPTLVDAAWRQC